MKKTITISNDEKIKEKKKIGIQIKNRWTGDIIFESEKTTYKEAVEEAVESGTNLSKADLYGADLSGTNLSGTNLYEADLSKADLSEANLYKANLYKADLSGTDLYEANLYKANLYKANLSKSDLYGAKFYGKTDNPIILKENQVDNFLTALGFKRE